MNYGANRQTLERLVGKVLLLNLEFYQQVFMKNKRVYLTVELDSGGN